MYCCSISRYLNHFSFALLWGPMNHLKHLFSMTRLPFTTAYFGTMFATLYFALWVSAVPTYIVQRLVLTHHRSFTQHLQAPSPSANFWIKIFFTSTVLTSLTKCETCSRHLYSFMQSCSSEFGL